MKFKFVLFFLFLLIAPFPTSALVQLPFGGEITTTFPCVCNPQLLLPMAEHVVIKDVVTGPTPLTFTYGLSRLNANYNIFLTKIETTGTYVPGTGVCFIGVIPDCILVPAWGSISGAPPLNTIGSILGPGIGTGAFPNPSPIP